MVRFTSPRCRRSALVACIIVLTAGLAHAQAQPAARTIVIAPVQRAAPSGNAGLFVGVNDFSDPRLSPLRFAVNDAVALAHLFVIELNLIEPGNAFVLVSGEPTTAAARTHAEVLQEVGVTFGKANRSTTLDRLVRVREQAGQPEDLVVVFLSSHGFEDRGIPYLMTLDAIHDPLLLAETGIRLPDVEKELSLSQAGKRLCWLTPAVRTRFVGTAV